MGLHGAQGNLVAPLGSQATRTQVARKCSWHNGDSVAKTESIQIDATVVKALPNAMFMVEAEMAEGRHKALCTIAGKMRKYYIRILPGDRVTVELSPYDLTRGRITYRHR